MSSRSYRLQIMLWHQSLKRIILEHFYCSKTKNPTDLRVKTWGGGIKDMLSPMLKHGGGGDTSPIPPGFTPLLCICTHLKVKL